jgi:glutathione S-transferase
MHKLYYSPKSCSLAPHIVLEEIGKPYQTELAQAGEGGRTRTAEWRSINPKGRVPALTNVPGSIGGEPNLLTEVPAILNFLADANPEAGLVPEEPAGRARVNEWLNWLSSNVHAMSFGQIWRPERFVDDERQHDLVRAKGLRNLAEQFAYIEELLGDGRKWAVGDCYSIADPYLLLFWRWGNRIEMEMRRYPAWSDLALRVSDRPAVRRVIERTGISDVW